MSHAFNYEIHTDKWHVCQICSEKIDVLVKKYGGSGKYKTDSFKIHLKDQHKMSLNDYFTMYDTRPLCKCNICMQSTNVKKVSKNFFWKEYACGRYPGTLKWSENAKIDRCGKNNPMFNKKPWNKNLNKNTSQSVKLISDKKSGVELTELHKSNLSKAAKKRKIHGHTGHKHSEITKEKIRQKTLLSIKHGKFLQTRTKPHIEMCNILQELNIVYEEEKIVKNWSFDIYIPLYNIFIEIDGDYWHSNPKIYPHGPITKTQKINFYRDTKKNLFCQNEKLKLLRFWESDILSNKESVICNLKKLLE